MFDASDIFDLRDVASAEKDIDKAILYFEDSLALFSQEEKKGFIQLRLSRDHTAWHRTRMILRTHLSFWNKPAVVLLLSPSEPTRLSVYSIRSPVEHAAMLAVIDPYGYKAIGYCPGEDIAFVHPDENREQKLAFYELCLELSRFFEAEGLTYSGFKQAERLVTTTYQAVPYCFCYQDEESIVDAYEREVKRRKGLYLTGYLISSKCYARISVIHTDAYVVPDEIIRFLCNRVGLYVVDTSQVHDTTYYIDVVVDRSGAEAFFEEVLAVWEDCATLRSPKP